MKKKVKIFGLFCISIFMFDFYYNKFYVRRETSVPRMRR